MNPTLVILLVGSFVGASCALVGSFLVLRKMALLGDAISHAVLPGMIERGAPGLVINTGSKQGITTPPGAEPRLRVPFPPAGLLGRESVLAARRR